ncbi:unnamed protein product [Mytilus coruscus]|uniref:Mutator-like transposase domain-containing protein n=1 Tax=Mytilus coruscus TaxID=42192 RepID=A0A6J8C6Z5_MYTCO|nr:unnamed protein product [Mytilus coruscus]
MIHAFLLQFKFSLSILQGCIPDAEKNLCKEWQRRKKNLNHMSLICLKLEIKLFISMFQEYLQTDCISMEHCSMIGKYTCKITNYKVRSRSCRVCSSASSRNETAEDRDCRKTWDGSAKAMEQDMTVEMVSECNEKGFKTGTVIGDDDSMAYGKGQKERIVQTMIPNPSTFQANNQDKGTGTKNNAFERLKVAAKLRDDKEKEHIESWTEKNTRRLKAFFQKKSDTDETSSNPGVIGIPAPTSMRDVENDRLIAVKDLEKGVEDQQEGVDSNVCQGI